jgi:putative thioredoxin
MNTALSIVDVNESNFEQDVLIASTRMAVLLDFWAPWCGPCKTLTPTLEKIAADFPDRVRLAKVNVDDNQQLAGMFGIRSVPTVMLLVGGRPIDGFVGAQPESAILQMLERHLGPLEASEQVEDPTAADAPELDERIDDARAKVAAEPDKAEHRLTLATVLAEAAEVEEAQALLDGLPPDLAMGDGARKVRSRLSFLAQAETLAPAVELASVVATHPGNLAARQALGVRHLLAGDAAAAVEQFLAVMKADRKFGDDLGRRSLIQAFDLIDDADLVAQTRRKMAALIF